MPDNLELSRIDVESVNADSDSNLELSRIDVESVNADSDNSLALSRIDMEVIFVEDPETHLELSRIDIESINAESENVLDLSRIDVEILFKFEEEIPSTFRTPPTNVPMLGCGIHQAFIQDKCHGPMICPLDDADLIYYERVLDDISEARVEISIGGGLEEPCCECLDQIEPWCHYLTITRDGEITWSGVVHRVTYGRDKVIIDAKDKVVWLTNRVNEEDISFLNNTTVSLTEIALEIATVAMADDDDCPCFLDCVEDLGDGFETGTKRSRFYPAFGGPYAFDDFQAVAESGIDYTVVNDCLIIGAQGLQVPPIAVLTDEHLLGEGVQIIKEGLDYANRFYVRYDGDDDEDTCTAQGSLITPCPALADTDDVECFCRVEVEISDGLGIPCLEDAQAVAETYLETAAVAPRRIEFPAGTRLSPNTPWKINDMIPGQRVDVALNTYCIPISQSFRLQKVEVTDTPEGEDITIELGNMNRFSRRI